jgi:hypothetical protein
MKYVHGVNRMRSNLIGHNSKLQFDILHFFLHFFHAAEKSEDKVACASFKSEAMHLSFIFMRGPASSFPLDLLSNSALMLLH